MSFRYVSDRSKNYVKGNQLKKENHYPTTAHKYTKYVKKYIYTKHENLNLEKKKTDCTANK